MGAVRTMLASSVAVSLATCLRMVSRRHLLVAVVAGAGVGLLVRGIPSGEVAGEAFTTLLVALSAVFLLPLGAGLPANDRRGGFEGLVAVRAVSSASWGLGRCLGALAGAVVLVVVLQISARVVSGPTAVPRNVSGSLVSSVVPRPAANDGHQWRFVVPDGDAGPFDLQVGTLLLYGGTSSVRAEVRRGEFTTSVERPVRPQRSLTLSLPDLSPAEGDLFVTLHAGPGMILSPRAPTLNVGTQSLATRRLEAGSLRRLLLGLLAAVAAACAFHFETACLAGLLAITVRDPPVETTVIAGGLLVVMAILGTALTRRQAMP